MEGWINGVLKKHTGSNAPLLHCSISYRRVSPGEYGFTSSDGTPGTNGATSKTRCGTWNKDYEAQIASGYVPGGRSPELASFFRERC
jgi:hypothetical protein